MKINIQYSLLSIVYIHNGWNGDACVRECYIPVIFFISFDKDLRSGQCVYFSTPAKTAVQNLWNFVISSSHMALYTAEFSTEYIIFFSDPVVTARGRQRPCCWSHEAGAT